MSKSHTGRGRLAAATFVAVVIPLGLAAGGSAPAGAAAPQGYAASDVIGQTDGSGNPVFTTSGANNNSATPSASGLKYPQGTTLGGGYLLYAADCANSRVLVYQLDSNDNVLSHNASFVIGQPNFTSNAKTASQSGFSCALAPVYDGVHKRLFVGDTGNNRVMVFDLSAGITNGMNASHVLGQANFTTGSCPGTTAASICQPYGGLAYDPLHDRLFVSDGDNKRVLEFDLSGGITDGMDATHVLGQPDFTTKACTITQSGLSYPYGMAYDLVHQRLYVADDSSCGGGHSARVLMWDLSGGITNGMNAAHILGKASFTDSTLNSDNKAAIDDPEDLSLDLYRQHLFVQDDSRNRMLVFDVANITDGEQARAVLGQPDFASQTIKCPAATQYNQCDAEGLSQDFDDFYNRLYLSDASYNRVLIYNFVQFSKGLTQTATVGTAYRSAMATKNGQGTVHYTVTFGSLPPGLTLNSASGLVSGTPTKDGYYSFAVTATDDNGAIGTFDDTQVQIIDIASIAVPTSGGAAG